MRKRIGCLLLTLALCMGLLPMTAWAAPTHTHTGDLDEIYTNVVGSPTGNTNVTNTSEGYKFNWYGGTDPKKLDIELNSCAIGGNLKLPDGCEITITLKDENTIAGEIQIQNISTGAVTLTITGNGNLTVTGTIKGSGNNGDKLIVEDGVEVTAKEVNIGASGCTDSYVQVDGEDSKLTLKENSTIAVIAATNGGEIVAKKGLTLAKKLDTTTFPFSRQIVVTDTSKITLGTEGGSDVALQTIKNGASNFNNINPLQDVVNNNLQSGYDAEIDGDALGSGNGFYVVQKDGTNAAYLTLQKYFNIQVINGNADKLRVACGDPITLTPNPAPSGQVFDKWEVRTQTADGTTSSNLFGTIDADSAEYNTGDAFTRYQDSETYTTLVFTAIYKSLGGDSSDDDSSGDDDSDSSGYSHHKRTPWYEIEPIPSDGCSIDVVEKEREHIAVDVTVNVKDGYICKGIIVLDGNGKSYTVRPQADGTFQFTMPDKDVTVEAILEKAEKPAATQSIRLTIGQDYAWLNGSRVDLDAAPVIRDGRTMLPARFVIEALGGAVAWDADAQDVTVSYNGKTIVIHIGAEFAEVDGKAVALDSPAFLENGRTYLPLRFIAENLGADVAWDAESRTVTITA